MLRRLLTRCYSSSREINITQLGLPVRDTITEYSGIVTKVALWMNGCIQNCVEAVTEENRETKLEAWWIDSVQLVPLQEIETKRCLSFQHALGSEAEDITGLKGKLTKVTVGMSNEVQYELQLVAKDNKMGASYMLSESRIKVTKAPPMEIQLVKDQPSQSRGGPMKKGEFVMKF